MAEVVRHWNQIVLDLKVWAALGEVGSSPTPTVVIAKG